MTVENISIEVKTNAGDAAAQFRALSSALGGVRSAAFGTQAANNGASSSFNSVSNTASKAASSTRSTARAMDDVAKSAKKVQSPLGNFVASLKRIAFYRFLRTILKEISQAIKEGLENVYEWSKAGGDMGEIAGALDRITSAGAQLKNQLGAAFGELLVALEPIIVALINLLTQLAQALTWVIALLSGKGYYPVAKQITKDWKEATGAANAYKNTILGFDEINRLNDEGGGGGGSPSGIGFDYEDLGIDLGGWWPKTIEWLGKLKDEFDDTGKHSDWLREKIEKLGDAIRSLPASKQIVISVATRALSAAMKALSGIRGMFMTIVGAAAEALPALEIGIKRFANSISVQMSLLAANIKATIGGITGSLSSIVGAAGQAMPVIEIGIKIASNIGEIFNAIKSFQSWIRTIFPMEIAIHIVIPAFETVIDKIKSAFKTAKQAAESWKESYKQNAGDVMIENATLEADMKTTFESIRKTIKEWVSDNGDATNEVLIENATLESDLKTTFGNIGKAISDLSDNYGEMSNNTQIENATLDKDIHDTFERIRGWIVGNWDDIDKNTKNSAGGMVINIKDATRESKDDVAAFTGNTKDAFGAWSPAIEKASSDAMSGFASNVHDAMENADTNMALGLSNSSQNIWKWAGDTLKSVANWAKGIVSNVKEGINAFRENNPVLGTLIFGVDQPTTSFPSAPLLPAWGGGYLIPVMASGGSITNNGTLFLAGEAGAEVVANMGSRTGVMNVDQMEAAVANGNIGVINAVYQMANMIVKALNEIDPDITLDGESLADKMYNYNQNAARRRGVAMVT